MRPRGPKKEGDSEKTSRSRRRRKETRKKKKKKRKKKKKKDVDDTAEMDKDGGPHGQSLVHRAGVRMQLSTVKRRPESAILKRHSFRRHTPHTHTHTHTHPHTHTPRIPHHPSAGQKEKRR